MIHPSRRLHAGLATVLAAAATTLTLTPSYAAVPSAGPAAETAREIRWKPCPEDPAARCGTLVLPVDWAKPAGATFELALVRKPATDPARRIGALFVNPGGPGGSGVDFALSNGGGNFGPELLARFDLIGVDPRGVARSHPVVCSAQALARPGDTLLPRSQAELDALAAYNKQLAADCRTHTGPLYDHVDSASVARDLDAVRAALGEDRLNWYGASYGSLIGQLYAELFPGRLRAMVNDGNMDHSLGSWAFQLTQAGFVEDSYDQFTGWCDRSTNCAVHGQDVRGIYTGLLAKADAGTLVDPSDGHQVSAWELLDTTQFFFSRPRWTQLGDWVKALHTGTATAAATAAKASFRADRAAKTHRTAKADLVEDVRPQFCQDWRLPVGDKATLVTYEGAGHTAYRRNDCTRGATHRYLFDLTVPPDGTTCAASDPA